MGCVSSHLQSYQMEDYSYSRCILEELKPRSKLTSCLITPGLRAYSEGKIASNLELSHTLYRSEVIIGSGDME